MEMNFDKFQIQKWISQTVRVEEKNWVIYLDSFSPSYCILCKSKSVKAIYLYPSERPHHALLENSMFYRGLSNSSRDIKKMLAQKSVKIHFPITFSKRAKRELSDAYT